MAFLCANHWLIPLKSHYTQCWHSSLLLVSEKVFSWSVCSDHVIFNRALVVDICSDLEDSVIVGNSGNYLRILRSWLSPVARSVNSAWKRCWRASVDGWAASTFHSRCDGKGPTVTIIRVGRYIFGGYTSVSWGTLTEWTEKILLRWLALL